MTMNWQQTLARVRDQPPDADYPMLVFNALPPSGRPWPRRLPPCPGLQEFWRICDGGYLAHDTWYSLAEAANAIRRWRPVALDPITNRPVLVAGRHIVFAEDASGAPIIWDAETDQIAAFYWRGGSWEPPLAVGFSCYLEHLFSGDVGTDDWRQAVAYWRGGA